MIFWLLSLKIFQWYYYFPTKPLLRFALLIANQLSWLVKGNQFHCHSKHVKIPPGKRKLAKYSVFCYDCILDRYLRACHREVRDFSSVPEVRKWVLFEYSFLFCFCFCFRTKVCTHVQVLASVVAAVRDKVCGRRRTRSSLSHLRNTRPGPYMHHRHVKVHLYHAPETAWVTRGKPQVPSFSPDGI